MQNKKELRSKILTRRRDLTKQQIRQKSDIICGKVLSLAAYKKADCVMAFASMPDEVQTKHIMEDVLLKGKQLCLPYIINIKEGLMRAAVVSSLSALVLGKAGILSVPETELHFVEPEQISLVIVPGVAFTKDGYRLGMGGGFYDRFLPKAPNAVKIGIGFSVQQVASVPVDKYDFPLDKVITENS